MRYLGAVAALLMSTSLASAAPFDWSGFYAGFSAGGALGAVDFPATYNEADHSLAGGLLGVQAGYNVQLDGNWVLGFEGSLHWAGVNGEALVDHAVAPWGDQFEGSRYKWTGTLAPRLGYAVDNMLIYAKAGVTVANYDAYFRDDAKNVAVNQSQVGALLGAGVDYAINDSMSVGVEYNLGLYGSAQRYNSFSTYATTTTTHAVMLRLNFHM